MRNETYGKVQYHIEHEWELTKLLTVGISKKLLAFLCGKDEIYLQSFESVKKTGRYRKDRIENPHIAVVRYILEEDIDKFVLRFKDDDRAIVRRIFKSTKDVKDLRKIRSFAGNVMKNVLHMCKGKSIYITSKSAVVRDIFYEIGVDFNKEDKLDVTFDYLNYDYTLELKVYPREEGKYAIITYLEENIPIEPEEALIN